MASIKLRGDTSGEVTIQAPAVAGTTTLNLPATSSTLATQNALGVRNLIINGDMRIAQRGTSASITGSAHQYQVIDRFGAQSEDGSGYNLSQSTDAPSDFNYSMLVTVTGTDTLDIASDNHCVTQRIEGYNIAHLNWGTANAKTVTLSFWVKSSLTGTFGGALSNAQDATRAYGFTYTINSANTWEYKTITIAGDTTGTWATNNGIGIFLTWSLGANSARQTTANQWDTIASRQATGAIGEDNIIGTSGATWQITGVQLEVGDTATEFEHRPYDMELARCQRYYEKSTNKVDEVVACASANGNYYASIMVYFMNEKRANPNITYSDITIRRGDNFNIITPTLLASNVSTKAYRATTGGTPDNVFQLFYVFNWTAEAEL